MLISPEVCPDGGTAVVKIYEIRCVQIKYEVKNLVIRARWPRVVLKAIGVAR